MALRSPIDILSLLGQRGELQPFPMIDEEAIRKLFAGSNPYEEELKQRLAEAASSGQQPRSLGNLFGLLSDIRKGETISPETRQYLTPEAATELEAPARVSPLLNILALGTPKLARELRRRELLGKAGEQQARAQEIGLTGEQQQKLVMLQAALAGEKAGKPPVTEELWSFLSKYVPVDTPEQQSSALSVYRHSPELQQAFSDWTQRMQWLASQTGEIFGFPTRPGLTGMPGIPGTAKVGKGVGTGVGVVAAGVKAKSPVSYNVTEDMTQLQSAFSTVKLMQRLSPEIGIVEGLKSQAILGNEYAEALSEWSRIGAEAYKQKHPGIAKMMATAGISDAAIDYNAALRQYILSAQSIVKGIPSNFDVQTVIATIGRLGQPHRMRMALLNYGNQLVRAALSYKAAKLDAQGQLSPEERRSLEAQGIEISFTPWDKVQKAGPTAATKVKAASLVEKLTEKPVQKFKGQVGRFIVEEE